MHASVRPRSWFCGLIVGVTMLGCGRTDPFWWSDAYASDSGTEDHGEGDGDGDETIGTSSTSMTSSTTDEPETGTTDSETTDSETTDSETTTETTETETTETETTETETTDTSCDDVAVPLTAVAPKVVFLVDQGAHMLVDFAGLSRWVAIGEALFGMTGVVWAWEDLEQLGLVSFTSEDGFQGVSCPMAEIVDPQLQNGAAMQLVHAALGPFDDNPAGEAIELAVPLFGGQPGHLILLLGRTPDTCNNPNNMMQGGSLAISAAAAAFASGVTTRVVEVGDIGVGFAQQLANVGLGLAPQGPDSAPFWQPGDLATLTADLDAILASLASCELTLEQSLAAGGEQLCSLTLDGMPAAFGDPEGWSLTAPDRIALAGAACQSHLQGATADLVCACEALEP